jgi:hypothetical protein
MQTKKAYYAVIDTKICPTLALVAREVGLKVTTLARRIERCKQPTYKSNNNGKSVEVFTVTK